MDSLTAYQSQVEAKRIASQLSSSATHDLYVRMLRSLVEIWEERTGESANFLSWESNVHRGVWTDVLKQMPVEFTVQDFYSFARHWTSGRISRANVWLRLVDFEDQRLIEKILRGNFSQGTPTVWRKLN